MDIFTIKSLRWVFIIILMFIVVKLWETAAKLRIKNAVKGKYDTRALSYFVPEKGAESVFWLAFNAVHNMGGVAVEKKTGPEYSFIADLKKQGQIVIFRAMDKDGGTGFTLTVQPRTFVLVYYWKNEKIRKEILQRMDITA